MTNMLITGAASGIGRAAARRMSDRMHVVAADLDREGLEALAAEFDRDGRALSTVEVDVSRAGPVERMAAWIEDRVGPVHAAFNCAGIHRRGPAGDIAEDDWDLMMATHVKGAFLCSRAVLPRMCKDRRGAIVNMSSDFAVMGVAGSAAYTAAKSAIFSLTKSMALEFAPYGIRVNALGPGPIDTPILRSGRTEAEWNAVRARYAERLPVGRLGRPEEVAAALDFLVSDRASYVTGQILHPNGGQLSW